MLITSPAALRHVIHWLTLVSEGLEADVLLAATVSWRVSHKSIDHNSDKPSAEWPQHLCISMNTAFNRVWSLLSLTLSVI